MKPSDKIGLAIKALLIAEIVVMAFVAPPLAVVAVVFGEAKTCAALGCLAWIIAPIVAFSDGRNSDGTGGGIYGHMARGAERQEAEMAKLLEEHKP